ncbi:MAG TPA: DUF4416 family protein [Thermodesulfobacteriota bacterium]|nr:DUF4416 family protein [Thermodesulfobacteriota bacterium]
MGRFSKENLLFFHFFCFSVGNPTNPVHVKLIASLICQKENSFSTVIKEMVSHFGSLDFVSATMPFDFTDYYTEEMGGALWRRIVGFETLIHPERLSGIKLLTNNIETSLSPNPTKRTVNIDPGYINRYHVILATTKPAPHRPYLKDGIYADLTLIYHEKGFKDLPWTYPDYAAKDTKALLNELRQKYLFQLKSLMKGSS